MTDGQMGQTTSTTKKEKKPNAWISHVQKFRSSHPELSYKECLKQAKETYWAKSAKSST